MNRPTKRVKSHNAEDSPVYQVHSKDLVAILDETPVEVYHAKSGPCSITLS